MKEHYGREEQLVAVATDTLKAVWPIGDKPLFVSGFSERCMRLCADVLPEVPRAIATDFVPRDTLARLQETCCQMIQFQAHGATE